MNTKIVKINIKGIKNFRNDEFEIDFFNHQKAYEKYYELDNLVSSLYVHTVMGLVGANASGKTMSLNLIKWCLDFFVNNDASLATLNKLAYFDKVIDISVMFFDKKKNDKIYKNYLSIDNTDKENPRISTESLYVKMIKERESKKSILDFSGSAEIERKEFEKLLVSNDIAKLSKSIQNFKISEKLSLTNYLQIYDSTLVYYESCQPNLNEIPNILNDLPSSLLKYLDNSIKTIGRIDESGESNKLYKLEFENGFSFTGNIESISTYLSSGTLRGIDLFSKVIKTLKKGGYLLIDEIEVSLHKSLVLDIIKLFNSKRTNPNNGILIFSTHYSEILDSIRRTDSLYLCSKSKTNHIEVDNFAVLMERNDISKSELYIGGLLNKPSSPNYFRYQEFLKDLETSLKKPQETRQ